MANTYDYIDGKKRIEEILNGEFEINEANEKIPQNEKFTFDNAYYGWVTGVFVDIRNSTNLFQEENKIKVAKIIKSFTSEIIEILRTSDLLREIGIRGDCVYAIYTSPKQKDEYDIFHKVVCINTFIDMLNKLLNQKQYPEIEIGIGIATAKELIVKAGRANTGINNLVWIGDAVTTASNLSSLANKNGLERIVLSDLTYSNIIEKYKKKYPLTGESWFTKVVNKDYYYTNIIFVDFNNWILQGMK
ncbi:MAG: adenylate/guanylate cyclase domain-containing protein [Endomicrobiaceae bacterium]|nr:adenylate/guanylate cyclase domain-containing protein [Endomicrobiaceae bacterium]